MAPTPPSPSQSLPAAAAAAAKGSSVTTVLHRLILSSAAFLLLYFAVHPYLPPYLHSPCRCFPESPSPPLSPISTTAADIAWLKSQLALNNLGDPPSTPEAWIAYRKGINPRTREKQLDDFRHFRGISHYDEDVSGGGNHTALPCPGELLVEEHHSNYGEPWAGGRDVFEFLANSVNLRPTDLVLEIGCGTLRVGLHFVRYLDVGRYHCLERDELSIMAGLRYEVPAQGLLGKRPMIVKGEDMYFEGVFAGEESYDLVFASAVFIHMPDDLAWVGIERVVPRLKIGKGRIFVSHNIKFCSRLGGEGCRRRLKEVGLELVGKHTHDSLLFNHFEIWFEFRRLVD